MATTDDFEPSGELARAQLAAAREDPRVGRGRGAMIADYWDTIEEAERVRRLGVMGLHELTQAAARVEQELAAKPSTDARTAAAELDAARERQAMAEAEVANEHPHLHATALVSMLSALDAMVEELVPAARAMLAHLHAEQVLDALPKELREYRDALPEAQQQHLLEAVAETVLGPPVKAQPRGPGVKRYEKVLRKAGLSAPPDRPLPDDLREALAEVIALRNVIVHRAGRVDALALEDAPSLTYAEGEFVRLRRADFRKYSAALNAYGAEIIRRLLRDVGPEVDLANWRHWYPLNA